ncbi:MAG: LON peptidase substrate-binding domain-containing protein [Planctomycetaceae bacterium]|nr:LON peptidase substrate-binding domain-containing protein [Planctomycetales bacterium]MCB9923726.1 LON peptidase substrate-binding domain-containing protein [Planctomycetaceae bacterium]
MAETDDKAKLPPDFDGRVRLFPLPNLVMFPHVVQPLHIFEPRYREMVEEALEFDQLIATAHLQPGWDSSLADCPAIYSTVCIGRIVSHARLDDGKLNILLLGLKRAIVSRELPLTRPFREAQIAVQEDLYGGFGAKERAGVQRELLHCFRRFTPETPAAQEQFESLMNNRLPLGVLTDIISFTMKFDLALKQQLLDQVSVLERAKMLIAELRQLDDSPVVRNDDMFPPRFSDN